MTLRQWTINKRPRGFELRWTLQDGRQLASYPVVRTHIPFHWVFYPYILCAAIRAMRQLRIAHS